MESSFLCILSGALLKGCVTRNRAMFKCYIYTWRLFKVLLSSLQCILRQNSYKFGFNKCVCFSYVYDIHYQRYVILLRLMFYFTIIRYFQSIYLKLTIRLIYCVSLLKTFQFYFHIIFSTKTDKWTNTSII